MSLPLPWVEKIFQKLTVTFGRDFVGRWEGLNLADVKADWAHELRGFQQNPQAIAYGLEHCLDGKPPTVQEFKAICCRRPDAPLAALPAPPADPARVAAELQKIATSQREARRDYRAWAPQVLARKQRGENVSAYAYKAAVAVVGGVVVGHGGPSVVAR